MVGNRISETLDLKIFWGSMPQTPLVWAAFGAGAVHTPSKSHAICRSVSYFKAGVKVNLSEILVSLKRG